MSSGKRRHFSSQSFICAQDIGRAEDVERRAAGAQPERLDERRELAVMVAVHVADPEHLGHVGVDFLAEQEAGGGGAAIEQEAGFLRLEQDAGMFPARAGVAVGRAEKNGAHGVDVAAFRGGRQSKMTGLGLGGRDFLTQEMRE